MQASALLSQGYFFAFLSVFVGGVLTSLTPCVYPMISITLAIFGARGQGGEKVPRGRALLLALVYVEGMAVMYTALGVSFGLAGKAFGTFMASPWVMLPVAGLLLVMAASMFGAFEMALPVSLQTRLSQVGGKGFGGAFIMGLVGGIIAAPCTGPVLASILAYVATTRSVAVGGSLLFVYAHGMGVLFFLLAAFAVSLPRSGSWMETVKSLFGVVMVVAALYFLRNVWPALARFGNGTALFAGLSAALILLGLIAGGLHLSFHDEGAGKRARKLGGVVALIAGGFGMVAWVLAPKAHAEAHALTWVEGEKPGLAQRSAEHKPALLDFFADWCLPCRELELKTFHDPAVARELQRFTLIKIDMTSDDDPEVVAVGKRYGADTLPTVLLMDREGKVAHKIDRYMPPDELLPLLRQIN
jgi:thiol:disulfide interchange protein DsbD